jgi:hypothetical protein
MSRPAKALWAARTALDRAYESALAHRAPKLYAWRIRRRRGAAVQPEESARYARAVADDYEAIALAAGVITSRGDLWRGRRVLELGPGDLRSVGLIARARGADRYIAVDAYDIESRDEEKLSANVGDTRKRLVRTMWNSAHWRNRHDAMRCFCVEREAFRADAEHKNARHALIRAARFIHALRDEPRVFLEIALAERTIEQPPHARQRLIRLCERLLRRQVRFSGARLFRSVSHFLSRSSHEICSSFVKEAYQARRSPIDSLARCTRNARMRSRSASAPSPRFSASCAASTSASS